MSRNKEDGGADRGYRGMLVNVASRLDIFVD